MTPKKAARMDASLIARKGQASPTQISADEVHANPAPTTQNATRQAEPVQSLGAPKSLTVKLDAGRYKALRQFGVDEDSTHQDIMVAALDTYLVCNRTLKQLGVEDDRTPQEIVLAALNAYAALIKEHQNIA